MMIMIIEDLTVSLFSFFRSLIKSFLPETGNQYEREIVSHLIVNTEGLQVCSRNHLLCSTDAPVTANGAIQMSCTRTEWNSLVLCLRRRFLVR